MDRLDRIRIFQMVAGHASFAAAARRLRIAPVAATRAVEALEKELGALLSWPRREPRCPDVRNCEAVRVPCNQQLLGVLASKI